MSGEGDDESIEDRIHHLIQKIDVLSHEASDKASDKFSEFSGVAAEKGANVKEKLSKMKPQPKKKKPMQKSEEEIRTISNTVPIMAGNTHSTYTVNPFETNSTMKSPEWKITRFFDRLFKAIVNHLQYTFPAIVLFSTVIWMGYLTDGTAISQYLENFCDWSGFSKGSVALLFFWGWLPGLIISVPLQNTVSADPVVAMNLVSVLLFCSSLMYFFRIRYAKHAMAMGFIVAILARIQYPLSEVAKLADFSLPVTLTVIFFTALFLFLFSLPRFEMGSRKPVEGFDIDNELISPDALEIQEASKVMGEFEWMDTDMTDPTETLPRPKRPRGRTELEMYEWVLLLVNTILWPISIICTMVVGANTEFMGMGPFNVDEHWLLLVGAWAPTMFFFLLLFKMDKAARDGQTFQMEKVAYQEGMNRYTEAKNAYMELLTLKAEVRKQQILDENPSVSAASAPTSSE